MNTLDYIIKKYKINLEDRENNYVVIPHLRMVDFVKLFAELGFKTGAEIGVLEGNTSKLICKNNPQLKLYAIDPWKVYEEYTDYNAHSRLPQLFAKFHRTAVNTLLQYNCEIIRKTSMEAVEKFKDESLDFVYIDGNHRLKYVIEDIIEWSKKIRKGGIVSGHDYVISSDRIKKFNCHVIYALRAYIESYNIDPVFILGRRYTDKRDYIRSLFFIKP